MEMSLYYTLHQHMLHSVYIEWLDEKYFQSLTTQSNANYQVSLKFTKVDQININEPDNAIFL